MRISLAAICAAAVFTIATQAAAESTANVPPTVTVVELRASPPVGKIVRITGYVVNSYLCPPCPEHAMCKPCMSESRVYVADAPDAPAIAIAVPNPAQFTQGKRYRFEVIVSARAPEGPDGRLLRSRPAEQPVWTTPAP